MLHYQFRNYMDYFQDYLLQFLRFLILYTSIFVTIIINLKNSTMVSNKMAEWEVGETCFFNHCY